MWYAVNMGEKNGSAGYINIGRCFRDIKDFSQYSPAENMENKDGVPFKEGRQEVTYL